MNAILHAQFERVETALTTLVESIASYNPSPQAALDLVAADDELSHGLDQLSRHQTYHGRILALRAEDEALESQLKSSISTLADLRHELFETPATTFPADSRLVPFEELLQFAKNISKYTVPPTYRERIPSDETDADKANDEASSGPTSSNGLGTPAVPPAPAAAPPTEPAKEGAAETATEGDAQAPKHVTVEQEEWLRKLEQSAPAWKPWPSHDKIWAGNLMKVQLALDQGRNPADVDIPKEEEEHVRIAKQRAEEQRMIEEQQKTTAAAEPPILTIQGPASTHAKTQPQEKTVYKGLDGWD